MRKIEDQNRWKILVSGSFSCEDGGRLALIPKKLEMKTTEKTESSAQPQQEGAAKTLTEVLTSHWITNK